MYKLFFIFLFSFTSLSSAWLTCHAHDFRTPVMPTEHEVNESQSSNSYVKYLGNESLYIQVANTKLLFDPFFHDNINIYQLVPNTIKDKIINGIKPFNQINTIFISHAHRDHFAVDEVVQYLLKYQQTKLVAPEQAIAKVKAYLIKENTTIDSDRLISVKLELGDQPWQLNMDDLNIEAVRVPHAGWPSRADVENIVFRVTLNKSSTIMHMGDADVDDNHYLPYRAFWQKQKTDINFPPYWFMYSAEGRDILDNIIGAKENVGIHVPMEVPRQLIQSGREYFSKPDENKSL
jgi:L-ascorbate metabolism protein UlaG (beta-lactamase superfamily)